MGTIYGTTVSSTIVQNVLIERLSGSLGLPPDAEVSRFPDRRCGAVEKKTTDGRVDHRKAAAVRVCHPRALARASGRGEECVRRRPADRLRRIDGLCFGGVHLLLGSQNWRDAEEVVKLEWPWASSVFASGDGNACHVADCQGGAGEVVCPSDRLDGVFGWKRSSCTCDNRARKFLLGVLLSSARRGRRKCVGRREEDGGTGSWTSRLTNERCFSQAASL